MCISALLSMIVLLWIGTGKGRAGACSRRWYSAVFLENGSAFAHRNPFHISLYGNLTFCCVAGASPRPTVGDEILHSLSKSDKHKK